MTLGAAALTLTPAATFALLIALLLGSCGSHMTYERHDRLDVGTDVKPVPPRAEQPPRVIEAP
jgi:hypothetical protein